MKSSSTVRKSRVKIVGSHHRVDTSWKVKGNQRSVKKPRKGAPCTTTEREPRTVRLVSFRLMRALTTTARPRIFNNRAINSREIGRGRGRSACTIRSAVTRVHRAIRTVTREYLNDRRRSKPGRCSLPRTGSER